LRELNLEELDFINSISPKKRNYSFLNTKFNIVMPTCVGTLDFKSLVNLRQLLSFRDRNLFIYQEF